jgi:hypothetical protein
VGAWREDLTLNNDAEYFTRVLLAAERVLFCKGARCYYRSGLGGTLSGCKSPEAWRSQFAVLRSCESNVRAREDSDRVRRVFALSWQRLAHQAYPYDAALAEASVRTARCLHPIKARADGGPKFRVIAKILGWRAARRLQVAVGGS